MNEINDGNCGSMKKKFPDYLTGDIDPTAMESIRLHVTTCTSCRRELEELTVTWTQLGVLTEEEPGPNLRKNFYTMLGSYKEGVKKEKSFSLKNILHTIRTARPAYQLAFSIILLIMGSAPGYFADRQQPGEPVDIPEVTQLRRQVDAMREQLTLSLLNQTSPSERLKGITWSAAVENPGEKTLDALLYTLNNDPNINVRLSAVDALYLFSHHPTVKEGIIGSLPHQTSPMVQVALIDLLSDMREKKAADALKQLIKKNKLDPQVKQRAELSIKQLI
ncbi:MAG: HEAT repeat domain-containing protein [bacterium]|nr:HEAT repeat domain-containing protein [bacterium]